MPDEARKARRDGREFLAGAATTLMIEFASTNPERVPRGRGDDPANFYPLEFDVRNLLPVLLLCLIAFSTSTPGAEEHGGGKEGESAGPQYLPMDPVIVNLAGRRHYLRANIQLLVDSAEHAEKIKHHTPAIRDALITLFSGRDPVALSAIEERENLRKGAREEIGKVLERVKANKGFEDIFFTDFMIQ